MDGGFPTTSCSSLLQSLIELCSEVERLSLVEEKKTLRMLRRVKLLSCLFQDIQHTILAPSSILCLTELLCVLKRTKFVITGCKEGSSVWNLIQTHHISNQFHALVKDMGRALDILPLSSLHITTDMREQVELLHKQAKRVDELGRNQDDDEDQVVVQQRRDDLVQLSNNKSKGFSSADVAKLKHVLSSSSIGLTSGADCDGEISKLEAEAQKQAGTGGLIVVSNINNLISLLTYAKSINIFDNKQLEDTKTDEESLMKNPSSSFQGREGGGVPDEFRCPISLELMKDPVIVSSGHTYDRNSIAQWINSGHHTCPKSGQRLIHMALIPNYALKSLVRQWCHDNNISSSQSQNHHPPVVIDHISASKAAIDSVKMSAEFLVGKLAMGSLQIQRQAAYELRLLAKTGMDTRRMIAEAGAIPFLVLLVNSTDSTIQENAVTALLNLSIFHNNKLLIVAVVGALDSIVGVVELGKTMEARENAAATIFSLSIIDECKVSIGDHPRAIISLVGLLTQGTTSGKRDAATALFNLAVYTPNKPRIVVSGAIPLLIQLLMDDKAGITDDALTLLAILLGCSQGVEETRKSRLLVPLLIDLLRFGSPKGKENAITLLLGLCKDGEEVAGRLLINPRTIPSLHSLAAHGSLKARRKADALLRLLNTNHKPT